MVHTKGGDQDLDIELVLEGDCSGSREISPKQPSFEPLEWLKLY